MPYGAYWHDVNLQVINMYKLLYFIVCVYWHNTQRRYSTKMYVNHSGLLINAHIS